MRAHMHIHMRTCAHTGKEKMKTEKTKKQAKPNRLRKPKNITLPEDCIEFVEKNGINLSQFVEKAIRRLISGLGMSFDADTADLVLISKKDGELSGPDAIRTRDLRHVRATS